MTHACTCRFVYAAGKNATIAVYSQPRETSSRGGSCSHHTALVMPQHLRLHQATPCPPFFLFAVWLASQQGDVGRQPRKAYATTYPGALLSVPGLTLSAVESRVSSCATFFGCMCTVEETRSSCRRPLIPCVAVGEDNKPSVSYSTYFVCLCQASNAEVQVSKVCYYSLVVSCILENRADFEFVGGGCVLFFILPRTIDRRDRIQADLSAVLETVGNVGTSSCQHQFKSSG